MILQYMHKYCQFLVTPSQAEILQDPEKLKRCEPKSKENATFIFRIKYINTLPPAWSTRAVR